MVNAGKHQATYGDGEIELLNMIEKTRRFCSTESGASTVFESSAFELQRSLPSDLQTMFETLAMFATFGSRVFVRHQPQGFPSYIIQQAYTNEKESFKKTVPVNSRSQVDSSANIVLPHVLYKVGVDDE